jgi:aminoglycoside 3-N-acetyltransferase
LALAAPPAACVGGRTLRSVDAHAVNWRRRHSLIGPRDSSSPSSNRARRCLRSNATLDAVPTPDVLRDAHPVARSRLTRDLRALGVHEADVVMAHVRLSEVGWVVGGVGTLVQALLDAVGDTGTVCAVTSWDDIPLHIQGWPEEWRRAYYEGLPAFDPEVSAANPSYGRFPERLRTWPRAYRSAHPDNGIAAVGAQAQWLTAQHSLDDSFGPTSPFARLVACEGRVLLLGAPLETMTLLHHAEAIAKVDSKCGFTYHVPLAIEGRAEWHELQDIDAEGGPFPYEEVLGPHDSPLAALARDALAKGIGVTGSVGDARSHLFPARGLVEFATDWIEGRFAGD